jgi:oligopeptidase A
VAPAVDALLADARAAIAYSYQWAEVLSADAYSLFEQEGVLSRNAGGRFRQGALGARRQPASARVVYRLPRQVAPNRCVIEA